MEELAANFAEINKDRKRGETYRQKRRQDHWRKWEENGKQMKLN